MYVTLKSIGTRGPRSQSAMHQFNEPSGVMFYSQIARNGIACWNSNRPFSAENHALIAADRNRMIYPADITVCVYIYYEHEEYSNISI